MNKKLQCLARFVCIGFVATGATIKSAHAYEYATFPTVEGCGVKVIGPERLKSISWSGKCQNGLIEGTGRFSLESNLGNRYTNWETYHQGLRKETPGDSFYYDEDKSSYFQINANTRATPLTEEQCLQSPACKAIHKVRMAAANKSPDDKQGNLTAGGFSGTADGFDFAIEPGDSLGVQVKGGPCVGAGVVGFRFIAPYSYIYYRQGIYRSKYDIYAYGLFPQVSGPPLQIDYSFNANFDWDGQVAAAQSQPDNVKRPIECLARSHTKYVEAVENWMLINKKMIEKHWGKWFIDNGYSFANGKVKVKGNS